MSAFEQERVMDPEVDAQPNPAQLRRLHEDQLNALCNGRGNAHDEDTLDYTTSRDPQVYTGTPVYASRTIKIA